MCHVLGLDSAYCSQLERLTVVLHPLKICVIATGHSSCTCTWNTLGLDIKTRNTVATGAAYRCIGLDTTVSLG